MNSRRARPAAPAFGHAGKRGLRASQHPMFLGRGVGATLTLIGLHHLAQRLSGADRPTVMLYVEADNSAAVNTYQRLGFEVSNIDVAYAAGQPR